MAMMVPDYALVAEVMLFAESFSDARRLAHKMTALYKVASEQLSQQVSLRPGAAAAERHFRYVSFAALRK